MKWRHAAALGVVLGLGYYAKSAMFPIGLMLLGLLFVLPPPGKRSRIKVLIACFCFLIVSAPLIALVSNQLGYFTIADTGRLAYAGYVNVVPAFPTWNPGRVGGSMPVSDSIYGVPAHRIHALSYRPLTIDFAEPVKGTNPLSYGAAYWWSGARAHFDLRQQWVALKINLRLYRNYFLAMAPIFAGALVLFIIDFAQRVVCPPSRISVWLVLWALGACGMYALVHVEERFLPGFLVLFWLSVYTMVWQGVQGSVKRAVLWTVLFSLLVPTTVHIFQTFKASIHNAAAKPDYVLVAEALRSGGIREGDTLAVAGGYLYGFRDGYVRVPCAYTAYYARYLGARVVAAFVSPEDDVVVPSRPPPEFWHVSPEELMRVKRALTGIGVRAIVALDRPADSTPDEWKQVTGTRYSVLFLNSSDEDKGEHNESIVH
jgi:hypothetical protein